MKVLIFLICIGLIIAVSFIPSRTKKIETTWEFDRDSYQAVQKMCDVRDSIYNTDKLKCEYYLDQKTNRMRKIGNDEIYENSYRYSLDSEKYYRNNSLDSADSSFCFNRCSKEIIKVHRFIYSLNNDIEHGHYRKSEINHEYSVPDTEINNIHQPEPQGSSNNNSDDWVVPFAGIFGLLIWIMLL